MGPLVQHRPTPLHAELQHTHRSRGWPLRGNRDHQDRSLKTDHTFSLYKTRDLTHDYKRHGTTTLFAALDVLTGKVIGQCLPKHRHEEFLKFLNTIDRQVPDDLDVHLILDNYATHKHAKVKAWMKNHPRFHFHFTPTSASWLNQVERWFRDLTEQNLRRGIFRSVPELIDSIEEYMQANNEDPKPYEWTATAESILDKVARARTSLNEQANQN